MANKSTERYFFYALLSAVAVVAVAIFWPFLAVIAIGAALAVVLQPAFDWISRYTKNKDWLPALLTLIAFVIVLGVPLFFIGSRVFHESQSLYSSIANGNADTYIDAISDSIHNVIPESANIDVRSGIDKGLSFVAGSITVVFGWTLSTALSLLLVLLSLFYFLKDSRNWKKYILALSPLADTHDEKILTMLSRAVNGVMKGYIFMALIQGALMGLGFFIFGVPNAVLWAVIGGVASMIPTVGTAIVSIPAILYLFAVGDGGAAIGLLAWAGVIVGMADNILHPVIVGKNIALPPLVILFAVLGGISLMGAPGVIIGPLAVSLLQTLARIYKEDFQQA